MPTTMANVIGSTFSYLSQLPLTFRISFSVDHYIVKWYNDYRFSLTMPSKEVLSASYHTQPRSVEWCTIL